MAHFAELNENNEVLRVLVIADEDTSDANGVEDESIGIAFCKKTFGVNTNWKKTSYNNKIRVRYAGIGYTYNEELDAFIPPQPFPSWVINKEIADWESPVGPAPELTEEELQSESYYRWDENTTSWVLETRQSA
jgi:hypothetical protein